MDKKLYVYSDHLYRGYFVADDDYGNEVCPECGDSDTLEYEGTYDEILSYLEDDIRVAQHNYNAVKYVLDKYRKKWGMADE